MIIDSLRVVIGSLALRSNDPQIKVLVLEDGHDIVAVDLASVSGNVDYAVFRLLIFWISVTLITDFEVDKDLSWVDLLLLVSTNLEFCFSSFLAGLKRLSEVLVHFIIIFR